MGVDLRADLPGGTGVTVWTVGHVHHSWDHYRELLESVGIKLVVDVRSRPYSRYAEQFNREQLEPALERIGLEYLWLGQRLGQRPRGEEFYDAEGYVLYERLAAQKWFLKDIGRIEYEASQQRVALTCLEEEPERCHRYWLLGKFLVERGAEVCHLRHDGLVERQGDIDHRLGLTQVSLFTQTPSVWRSPMPMRDAHGG
jgi:uncharacterized protein (DUF488 family)